MLIVWDSHILLITSLGVSQLLYCCQFCSKIGLSCMDQEVNHAVHMSTERGRQSDTRILWNHSRVKPEYLVTLFSQHWVVHSLYFKQVNEVTEFSCLRFPDIELSHLHPPVGRDCGAVITVQLFTSYQPVNQVIHLLLQLPTAGWYQR